jgi:hypothetical protein
VDVSGGLDKNEGMPVQVGTSVCGRIMNLGLAMVVKDLWKIWLLWASLEE